MSAKKQIWIFLIFAPLFGVFLAGIKVYYDIQVWRYEGPPVMVEIQAGQAFSKVNAKLINKNLISNGKVFHRYSQVNGYMTKFKAGQYEIKSGMNMLDIIHLMLTGAGITVSVTIPEGKNLYEVAEMLAAKEILKKDDFIRVAKSIEFAKKNNIPAETIEGYLFPDTYQFSPNGTSEQVAKMMINHYKQKVKGIDMSSTSLNPHEVVILASIVEKETGAAHERPMIAGVYLNRLKKKMRLYSDPTTIYGIWETWDGNLRKRHLQQKTEYNTYKIGGLPKGPIANPGLASIKAVLEPAQHEYLYFVSKNDGTHVFSKTYKEHLKAVDYWQKNRKNRKGKSWRDLKKKSAN